jgi:cobalamin biosynthesis protein CobW
MATLFMNNEKPEFISKTEKSRSALGIPALVVSGFLGAGKTTLVKHLLADARQHGLRLAVVSNEFGELGIDQALLQEEGGPGYVELEGGCVCCQLSGELLKTLQNLWETIHPDRVVVETSGVALPFETLLTFWREPVSEWVGESLAVVVVNAEQVAEERDLEGTFEQQVSSADLLILNKIDLVEENSLTPVEPLLQNMAPGAPILRSIQGQVDSKILFPPNPAHSGNVRRCQNPDTRTHTHQEFISREISIPRNIPPEQLIEQVRGFQALRVKGIVHTSQGLRLVQGVGPRVDLVAPPTNFPTDIIGRIITICRK